MIPQLYPIADGIRLRACRTDRFKSGTLTLSAVLPIDRERTPLTTLLLSVLRRGTRRFPTLADINRRLDYLYGTELSIRNFYRGDRQVIGFSVEVLDRSYLPENEDLLPSVLEVIDQLLFFPLRDENGLLCERYVESEKQLQCDAIRAQKNEPRGYAADRMRELMFDKEPCGVSVFGTEEQIMAVGAKELTAHYEQLLQDLTLDCFYLGPNDPQQVAEALRQGPAAYLSQKGRFSPTALSPAVLAETVRRHEETLPVAQGQLLLSWRTGVLLSDEKFYACALCNEILGLSPVSKLFVRVREQLSLCYSCASHYNSHKGVLTVQCGLDPANRELAEREILSQVEAMAQGDFTEADLCAAKNSLRNAYRQIEDSPAALENFYFGRSLAGMDISAEECRRAFERVTRAEIISVARGLTLDTVYFLNGTRSGEENTEDEEEDETQE